MAGEQANTTEETLEETVEPQLAPTEHIADALLRGGLRGGASASNVRAWEYPLAKDEQKHRVWQLYERELVLLQRGATNAAVQVHQELQTQNPQIEETEEALNTEEEQPAEVPVTQHRRKFAKTKVKKGCRTIRNWRAYICRPMDYLRIRNVMLRRTVTRLRQRNKLLVAAVDYVETEKERLLSRLLRSVDFKQEAVAVDEATIEEPSEKSTPEQKIEQSLPCKAVPPVPVNLAVPSLAKPLSSNGLNPEAKPLSSFGLNPAAKPFIMEPVPSLEAPPTPPTGSRGPGLSRASKSLPSLSVAFSSLATLDTSQSNPPMTPGHSSPRDDSSIDSCSSDDDRCGDLGTAPLSARGSAGPAFFDLFTPRTPGRHMQTPRLAGTPGRSTVAGIAEEDDDWLNPPIQKGPPTIAPRYDDLRDSTACTTQPGSLDPNAAQLQDPEAFAAHWGLDDGALRGLQSLPVEDQRVVMHLVDQRPGRNPSATTWSKVKAAKDRPPKMRLEYLHNLLDGRCLEALRLLPSKVQEDVAMKLGDPSRCRNLSAFVWAEIKAVGRPRPHSTLEALPTVAVEVAASGVKMDGRALEALAQLPPDKRTSILAQVNPRTCRNPSAFVCSKVREMQSQCQATIKTTLQDVMFINGTRRRGGC